MMIFSLVLLVWVWALIRRLRYIISLKDRYYQEKCALVRDIEELETYKERVAEWDRQRIHANRLLKLSQDPKRPKGGSIRAEDDAELDRQEGRPPRVYYQRTRAELGLVSSKESTSPPNKE